MEGLRHDSLFARYVAERLVGETFQLADVGCLGGLDPAWRAFGDRLQAIGFDINEAEVARLNEAETSSRVIYSAQAIGLPNGHPLGRRLAGRPTLHRWPSWRLSYQRTQLLKEARAMARPAQNLKEHYAEHVWSQTQDGTPPDGWDTDYRAVISGCGDAPPSGADGPVLITEALNEMGLTDLDFLKIDVDGGDFEILRSGVDFLKSSGLLGVGIEVNFVGSHDANDNTFHNVDRFMRAHGFDLFNLTTRQYSSAALPWPNRYETPGVTAGGRPVQGDALYLRDLSSPLHRLAAAAVSDEKLLKLAAIFALANLPDEAAEMLLAHEARLRPIVDIDQSLDLLALQIQENDGTSRSYADYIAAFEADAPEFLDQDGRRSTWLSNLIAASRG